MNEELMKSDPGAWFPSFKAKLKSFEEMEKEVENEIQERNEEIVADHYRMNFTGNRDSKWEGFREMMKMGARPHLEQAAKKMRQDGETDYAELTLAVVQEDFDKFSNIYEKIFSREYHKDFPTKESVRKAVSNKIEEVKEMALSKLVKIAGKTYPVIGFKEESGHKLVKIFCPEISTEEHNSDYILDLYSGPVERIPDDLIATLETKAVADFGLEV